MMKIYLQLLAFGASTSDRLISQAFSVSSWTTTTRTAVGPNTKRQKQRMQQRNESRRFQSFYNERDQPKKPSEKYESKIQFNLEGPFESNSGSSSSSDIVAPKIETQNDQEPVKKSIWETDAAVTVQGDSLRTWSFRVPFIDRVQVLMKTQGRPLSADIDLWHGPDNTPQRMRIYIEDASIRPFSAVIETPGDHNAIAIRNTATLEYPLQACVEAELDPQVVDDAHTELLDTTQYLLATGTPKMVQGGSVLTKPFAPNVASVQILLITKGRPLLARIEVLQGPNNSKQVMEVYTEHGFERPFFVIVETPGFGNVVRIVNTGTLEYPLTAYMEPYRLDDSSPEAETGGFFIVN